MEAHGTGNAGYSLGIAVGFYGACVALAAVPTALVLAVNHLRKVKWRAGSYLWILFVTGSIIAGLASIGNKMTEDAMKRLDRDRRSEMPRAAPPGIVSAQSLRTHATH